MFFITLTNWDDLLWVGGLAAFLAALVSRGKDVQVLYNWGKIGLQSIQRRTLRRKVFLLEELKWHEWELDGLARWQTGWIDETQSWGALRVTSETCRLVGLPEQDILREGWKAAVHPAYTSIISKWDASMKNGTNFQGSWAFLHQDKAVKYVYGRALRITDKNGNFIGALGQLWEVTKKDVDDCTDA